MLEQTVRRSFIEGAYVDSPFENSIENLNPATGESLGVIQCATSEIVDEAVTSGVKAHREWSSWTGAERGRVLRNAANLLRRDLAELARLEVLDTGKPIQEALDVDVISGADCLDFFAGIAPGITGQHVDFGTAFGYTRRESLGVCAGIGAWNYPLQIACWKSAPALACGNTMVFKPSEMTPTTAGKLAELYIEAGVPPGVFNVVVGGPDVGKQLVSHPNIAKVSLTGNVETGKKVVASSAATLKHVSMELGGKSPLIIFEDADLRNAVSASMLANFYTQGEVCSNGTRVFVHESIVAEFMEALVPRVSKLRIGDPMKPDTQVGALISKEHSKKVLDYIKLGVEENARLVCGGKQHSVAGCESGYFVEPTIFTDCTDDMRIVREEIFGPVMSVLTFNDEDEVIRRANDTDFGLAAGVFTKDLARAHRVVAQLEAGTCWINNYNITPIELPFGGNKQSGLGRENGWAAVHAYTQEKSVYVELSDVDCPYD
jgi:betaine-aldehyde dehydrogenase